MKYFKHLLLSTLLLFLPLIGKEAKTSEKPVPFKPLGNYEPKDFSYLIGTPGFDDSLLNMHFTLYKGYVKNTNLLITLLQSYAVAGKPFDYQYQALKRRFGWEFDGMRLHEFYFGNLGGKAPLGKSSALYTMIVRDFGSYENWKRDYIATGMIRGIGWSILYFDPKADRLFNTWINEHDLGHLAGGDLILVMDVWEHAYITQYGLDRAKYIDVFFQNINWKVVAERFHNALIRR
ncbi:MAG: Superoxide dismutase [Fe] [Chlamydiae bacterium]|nr:Superoxide dismutase [Fe] [Chlamydiota bacterium]